MNNTLIFKIVTINIPGHLPSCAALEIFTLFCACEEMVRFSCCSPQRDKIILFKTCCIRRYWEVFSFTFGELSTSSKPALQYWRSELVKAVAAAKVDEKDCTKLLCKYSQSMDIGELLADALSKHIRNRRPKKLEFVIPDQVACPLQLRLFLKEVCLHHQGALRLNLLHSYNNYVSCDNVVEALAGAR